MENTPQTASACTINSFWEEAEWEELQFNSSAHKCTPDVLKNKEFVLLHRTRRSTSVLCIVALSMMISRLLAGSAFKFGKTSSSMNSRIFCALNAFLITLNKKLCGPSGVGSVVVRNFYKGEFKTAVQKTTVCANDNRQIDPSTWRYSDSSPVTNRCPPISSGTRMKICSRSILSETCHLAQK